MIQKEKFSIEFSQFLLDVLLVNVTVILSFTLRFGLSVNVEQIYKESAVFTFPIIIITPILLRLVYFPGLKITTKTYSLNVLLTLLKLLKTLSLNSIIISVLIVITTNVPVYKSLIILSWFLNFIILAIFRGPWSKTILYPSIVLTNNWSSTSVIYTKFYPVLRLLIPKKDDFRSLIIGALGSIIAFLIIYHLLGYK